MLGTSSMFPATAVHRPKQAVWGIHNYYDATYFGSAGVDKMLSITDGPIWLTEVGGLVTFRSSTGTLPYDEHRAADSLRWIFTLALRSPRIERAYLYGMWQESWNPFDSALLRQDNSEREGMGVVRAYVGPRKVRLPGPEAPPLLDPATSGFSSDGAGGGYPAPGNGAAGPAARAMAGSTGSTGALRVVGKRLVVDPRRRTKVTVRCIGPAQCVGRFEVVAGSWRYGRGVRLAAGAQRTVVVRLPRRATRALTTTRSPRAWVTSCDQAASCATSTRTPMIRRAARR